MNETPFNIPRARLDLKTLVVCAFLVGFFAGLTVVAIAIIVALFNISTLEIGGGIGAFLVSPILFGAGAALYALLAYPFYRWATNRYFSHSVSGVRAE